jgi:hypothetical protein
MPVSAEGNNVNNLFFEEALLHEKKRMQPKNRFSSTV